MKTTVEISDALLAEARELAAREGKTLRALIEQGVRHVLHEHKRAKKFRLRDGSFKGEGFQSDFAEADWDSIRDAIYKGRGG